jgi:glutamine synthetase
MGNMLTQVIEDIANGKTSAKTAEQAMITLGVTRLPEVAKDNTDRNRTSPFAFTGNKFEFRAVGSSQSIAFPVTILNAAVAEAIGDITEQLRKELGGSKAKKDVENAVLKVVRKAFKASTPIRFEGNNYSEEWVKEAAKRKLPNLRRTPEALAQLRTDDARTLMTELEILSADELESRYHVRVERYIKDMLIEIHSLRELVDTFVLPAGYAYAGELAQSAAAAKAAGIKVVPQVQAAERVGSMILDLEKHRAELVEILERAEGMHESLESCSELLTGKGADAMQRVRACCDALEMSVPDSLWPLPKYREMLFPV